MLIFTPFATMVVADIEIYVASALPDTGGTVILKTTLNYNSHNFWPLLSLLIQVNDNIGEKYFSFMTIMQTFKRLTRRNIVSTILMVSEGHVAFFPSLSISCNYVNL